MKIIKKTMILMIRGYQKYLSPLKRYTHCIYTPTCSQYAIEALEKYGVFKGTWLACKGSFVVIPLQKAVMIQFRRKTSTAGAP